MLYTFYLNYATQINLQGFGKELLETLPGRIGVQDVFDIFAATESLLAVSAPSSPSPPSPSRGGDMTAPLPPAAAHRSYPLVDERKLGIMGGSHGGFLAAHCIGQRPAFFQAAVLRNPVTNVLANSMTSDIGDWCVVEGCGAGAYDFSKFASPTMAEHAQMFECSPVRYALPLPCLASVPLSSSECC
jgi:acylaminoacyl-peptidase